MKSYILYILLILFAIHTEVFCQEKVAFITTTYNFIDKDLAYYFEINGVDVSASNQHYPIPINIIGFDTIKFSFNNNPLSVAIMKMQEGKRYDLKSNTCSMYTIQPQEDARIGMTKFRIESNDSTSYIVSVDELSQRKISRETVDEFYYSPPSAMCVFSAKSIKINTLDGVQIKRIPFHFLHGELVEVVYNEASNTTELKIHSHIRSEKEYRHMYSNKK